MIDCSKYNNRLSDKDGLFYNQHAFLIRMNEDFTLDIEQCLQVLEAGGIILYPTDTVWGLGCDAGNETAVEKIIALKKRPENKSFVVLASTEKEIIQHVAGVDLSVFDYLQQSEKPVTVVYDNALGFAANVLAADGSVAIRICGDVFCKHLIRRFRKPIVSTSANTSGRRTPALYSQIEEEIISGVDYVVNYRQQDDTPTQPSSIIRWVNGEAVFLRK